MKFILLIVLILIVIAIILFAFFAFIYEFNRDNSNVKTELIKKQINSFNKKEAILCSKEMIDSLQFQFVDSFCELYSENFKKLIAIEGIIYSQLLDIDKLKNDLKLMYSEPNEELIEKEISSFLIKLNKFTAEDKFKDVIVYYKNN